MKILYSLILSILCSNAAYGEKLQLKNGAPLFSSLEKSSPRQIVVISYMGGAYTVEKQKQGLTSLLSDILNTGPADMKEEDYKIQKFLKTSDIGFSFSKKSSSIYVQAPPEHLEETLTIVGKILSNPRIDKKTFDEKKNRVLTNRAAMDDNMKSVVGYVASKYVFNYHPITLGGTGTVKTISSVTMDDLSSHMKTLFDEKRAFAASFGPMDSSKVAALVNKTIFSKNPPKFERYPFAKIDVSKYVPKTDEVLLIDKPGSKDNPSYLSILSFLNQLLLII